MFVLNQFMMVLVPFLQIMTHISIVIWCKHVLLFKYFQKNVNNCSKEIWGDDNSFDNAITILSDDDIEMERLKRQFEEVGIEHEDVEIEHENQKNKRIKTSIFEISTTTTVTFNNGTSTTTTAKQYFSFFVCKFAKFGQC
jgi:hypothetical protein